MPIHWRFMAVNVSDTAKIASIRHAGYKVQVVGEANRSNHASLFQLLFVRIRSDVMLGNSERKNQHG